MEQEQKNRIYTVTRLNREARAALEDSFPVIWVRGEISNLAQPGSGHVYFSLKDEKSQVRCAMFKNRKRHLKFSMENGLEVLVQANVSLYEGRGEFQLIVEQVEPAGAGALQQQLEKLKQRLLEKGLFDKERKLSLPAYPKIIGVVTSPTGAAVRDILQVLRRRYAIADVIIYPVPVQGEGSARQIADTINTANQRRECDVLIIARGGGSLEDLWSFNEESVAWAIYQSTIPVVSGIGHEIDFTIADFVADQRAPTPSAAAELVSPDVAALQSRLANLDSKLDSYISKLLDTRAQYINQLFKRLPRPVNLLQNMIQRVDDLTIRLKHSAHNVITLRRARLNQLAGAAREKNPIHRLRAYRDKCAYLDKQLQDQLDRMLHTSRERLHFLSHALNTVSPLSTLERGYAIVTDKRENIIREAGQLRENAVINTKFSKGSIRSTVRKIIPDDENVDKQD